MTEMRRSETVRTTVLRYAGRLLLFALIAGGISGLAAASAPAHPSASLAPPPPALSVGTPTTNTSTLDLGMPLNVSISLTQISGGSGNASNWTFTWLGLPTNCTSQNLANYTCYPTATGAFSISLKVSDSGTGTNATSAPVSITVNTDPTLGGIVASAASVSVNATVTFTTTASGGSPPLTYVYSGLPRGCNGNTSSVTCQPTIAQAYNVTVYVVDSVGMATNTSFVVVTVTAPSPPAATSHPTPLEWAIIGLILIVGFAASALLFLRARRVERGPFAGPARPPSGATGPGPAPPPGGGPGAGPPPPSGPPP